MTEDQDVLIQVRIALGETIRAHGNTTWNVSEEVGMWLRDQVIVRQATRVLEIGTSIGYSTLFLAEAARTTGGHVTTVESHAERGAEAAHTFTSAKLEDVVTLIGGHAPEVFSQVKGPWDFVFLDATKYEHVSYIQAILPELSDTVCIIADNCLSHAETMKPYMDFMRTLPRFTHELMNKGSGVFVSTRD